MKKILAQIVIILCFISPGEAQEEKIKEKLASIFFGLSLNVDIDVIRTELGANPDFRFYHDPNRDSRKTIIGTIEKAENLNPICPGNQVIIQYSSAESKKNKKVSFKWSMDYKHEDLASARVDFDKLKAEFKTFFKEFSETKKHGEGKEIVNTLTLKENTITIKVVLIEYKNFIHTVSIEYFDNWKIKPVQIIKVKS
ncbi:MAG TPA: hypothetical protein VFU05_01650 [Cyclobacteriaceae bacterium]|nr:hypothetical protein [Cyclobacteriaceae bacterium]